MSVSIPKESFHSAEWEWVITLSNKCLSYHQMTHDSQNVSAPALTVIHKPGQ